MKKFLLALILIFLASSFAEAELEYPEVINERVNDWANILSESEEQRLEKKLAEFEQESSNQIVVATFDSLAGENLEEISMEISEIWKVGQADKNNGVILLIFAKDRKLRIEVGYGLEPYLTDYDADRIIRNNIAPLFKEKEYYLGIDYGIDAIISTLEMAVFRAQAKKRQENFSTAFGKIQVALILFLQILIPTQFLIISPRSYLIYPKRKKIFLIDFGILAISFLGTFVFTQFFYELFEFLTRIYSHFFKEFIPQLPKGIFAGEMDHFYYRGGEASKLILSVFYLMMAGLFHFTAKQAYQCVSGNEVTERKFLIGCASWFVPILLSFVYPPIIPFLLKFLFVAFFIALLIKTICKDRWLAIPNYFRWIFGFLFVVYLLVTFPPALFGLIFAIFIIYAFAGGNLKGGGGSYSTYSFSTKSTRSFSFKSSSSGGFSGFSGGFKSGGGSFGGGGASGSW